MSIVVEDRRATRAEVVAHRDVLLDLANKFGLANLRVREDGALVATVDSPGYRAINKFAAAASQEIGAFPVVIADDTPGADLAAPAL
jgi:hypothetical protein